MYCLLVDPVPMSVEIDGIDYPISSNFRVGILFEQMMADRDLSKMEQVTSAIMLYYPEKIPSNVDAAIEKIQWFHQGGKEVFQKSRKRIKERPKRILDYEHDDALIYGAFMSQYGMDLQDVEYLHWWKFHAMLGSLRDDLPLVRIMGYRGMELASIEDAKTRAKYAELQAKYSLSDAMTHEGKVAAAGSIFAVRGLSI